MSALSSRMLPALLTLGLSLSLSSCQPDPDVPGTPLTITYQGPTRWDGHTLTLNTGSQVGGTYVPGAAWTSSDPSVATVTAASSGAFTVRAVAEGTSTLHATSAQGAVDFAVVVTAPVSVSGVTVSPGHLALQVGTSGTLRGVVDGTGAFNADLTWTSANPAVATVNSSGLVTAGQEGSTVITATSVQDPRRSAQVPVVVSTAPPPQDGFDVTVVFPQDSGLSATQKAAFEKAAQRWSSVIRAGLPDLKGVLLPGGVRMDVDDLAIVSSSKAVDGQGNTVAMAGPYQLRPDRMLPASGEMIFDSADINRLEAQGQLESVVMHEMGHVLGLGTLWSTYLTYAGGACSDATRIQFSGARALSAYRTLGGVAAGVPVEDGFGTGTKCAHWKESVFQTEVMTGFINVGRMPLSSVTVGALADLGYDVNFGAAEAYTLPDVNAQAVAEPLHERVLSPAAPRYGH